MELNDENGLVYFDGEFRQQVERSLARATESVGILAGYTKVPAMEWLARHLRGAQTDVAVVVGWTIRDLVEGSSDLDAYKIARDQGWKFGIRPDLHAKVFWIDRRELLIGSANLTSRGLHLGVSGNTEAGVRITPTNVDRTKLEQLLTTSLWLDEKMFIEIEAQIKRARELPSPELDHLTWPQSVEERLARMNDYLWVDDLLLTNPKTDAAEEPELDALVLHDRGLLGNLYKDDEPDKLTQALRRIRLIKWIKHFLTSQDGRCARFGTISAALHDGLLDDPRPYRRDVKALQANLFAWIEHAQMPEFEFRKYRRTTSIHLVSDPEEPQDWF